MRWNRPCQSLWALAPRCGPWFTRTGYCIPCDHTTRIADVYGTTQERRAPCVMRAPPSKCARRVELHVLCVFSMLCDSDCASPCAEAHVCLTVLRRSHGPIIECPSRFAEAVRQSSAKRAPFLHLSIGQRNTVCSQCWRGTEAHGGMLKMLGTAHAYVDAPPVLNPPPSSPPPPTPS